MRKARAARSQPRDFIARSILLTPRKYELLYLDVRSISLVHTAVSLFYLRIKKQSRGALQYGFSSLLWRLMMYDAPK